MKTLKVLLIGSGLERAPTVLSYLARRGCQCVFTSSFSEASRLLREGGFDLVLSALYVGNENIYSLREELRGQPVTLLYACEVEAGCWWLLGLDRGTPCLGDAPAIRPGEFLCSLQVILDELSCDRPALPALLQRLTAPSPVLRTGRSASITLAD